MRIGRDVDSGASIASVCSSLRAILSRCFCLERQSGEASVTSAVGTPCLNAPSTRSRRLTNGSHIAASSKTAVYYKPYT